MTTLAIELVRTDDALRALIPEWETLWRWVPDALPFQSPAWLLPWWDQFGTGEPRIAVLRAGGGRPIGLLPLYILEEPPERKLLLIGAGTTDYLDLLLAPEAPPDAAQRLLDATLAHAAAEGVTACDLTDLPAGSPLRDVTAPPDWRDGSMWRQPCVVLPLPTREARLADVVREGKLRDVRLARNRAERIGGWSIQVADEASLKLLLGALLQLHQARWSGRGEPGVFADPRVAAFHHIAAPGLLARGLLRLYALRFGERIAAAFYTLPAGADRLLFYLTGFDANYARESPGTILMGAIIEAALNEGRRELHFLRGSESYKYDWGGVERPTASRRLLPTRRRD